MLRLASRYFAGGRRPLCFSSASVHRGTQRFATTFVSPSEPSVSAESQFLQNARRELVPLLGSDLKVFLRNRKRKRPLGEGQSRREPIFDQVLVATFRREAFSIDIVTPPITPPAQTGEGEIEEDPAVRMQQAVRSLEQSGAQLARSSGSVRSALDEKLGRLRYLALGMGRMLRFGIYLPAPNASSTATSVDPGQLLEDPADEGESPLVGAGLVEEAGANMRSGQSESTENNLCVVFVKDDWHLANRFIPMFRVKGRSPIEAFDNAVSAVLDSYDAESQHSPQALEDVQELSKWLHARGVSVLDHHSAEEAHDGGMGFSSSLTILDGCGNTYKVASAKQKTAYVAYRSCALQVIKHELNEGFRAFPARLLWSIDSLCEAMFGRLGANTPSGSQRASELVHAFLNSPADEGVRYKVRKQGTSYVSELTYGPHDLLAFLRTDEEDGAQKGHVTASGIYALQLETFYQALKHLIEVCAAEIFSQSSCCFKSAEDLTIQYLDLLSFSVVDALKDAKLTPYAAVGALTWKHFHEYYTVNYSTRLDPSGTEELNLCEILVKEKVLGSCLHKSKGQAWKLACIDIIQNNFPSSWKELQRKPEFHQLAQELQANLRDPCSQAGGGTTNQGGSAGTNRSVPEPAAAKNSEPSVASCNNLHSLLQQFGRANRETSWNDVSVEVAQLPGDGSRWQARFLVKTESQPDSWEAIITTPVVHSKHLARKFALYLAATKYFPEQLEAYLALGRTDVGSSADIRLFREKSSLTYDPSKSFLAQMLDIFTQEATSRAKPSGDDAAGGKTVEESRVHFSCKLTLSEPDRSAARPSLNDGSLESLMAGFHPRFLATLLEVRNGSEEKVVFQHIGQEGHSAATTLISAFRSAAYNFRFQPEQSQKLDRLWEEYSQAVPNQVISVRDLCQFLFTSFFGGGVTAETEYVESHRVWVSTLVVTEMGDVPIARSYAAQKKDAAQNAWIVGAKANFERILRCLEANPSAAHIVDELYSAKTLSFREAFPVTSSLAGSPPPLPTSTVPPSSPTQSTAATASHIPMHLMTPPALLKVLMEEQDPGFIARHEQYPQTDGTFQCIIFRQKDGNIVPNRGQQLQILGRSVGPTKRSSLHLAAIEALRKTFPEDLDVVLKANPNFCDPI
jgi:hypothetical protein